MESFSEKTKILQVYLLPGAGQHYSKYFKNKATNFVYSNVGIVDLRAQFCYKR